MTYIWWSSDFALHLENYLIDEVPTLDNGSVWHKGWPHKIYVGQWLVFCGPVILLNILETVWWNIIFGIIDQCDTKVGLFKQMWVSDLHFMVQWFCLISWRLFDGWRLSCVPTGKVSVPHFARLAVFVDRFLCDYNGKPLFKDRHRRKIDQ